MHSTQCPFTTCFGCNGGHTLASTVVITYGRIIFGWEIIRCVLQCKKMVREQLDTTMVLTQVDQQSESTT